MSHDFEPPKPDGSLWPFSKLTFTPAVKAAQEEYGGDMLDPLELPTRLNLGLAEQAYIAERDSFYMATVSETGWPYVQHKGGQPGFLQVAGPRELILADYNGNRQFVSLGNLKTNPRMALILVDYTQRRRLKLMASLTRVEPAEQVAPEVLRRLPSDSRSPVARVLWLQVHAFDWNCPNHITPRFTFEETP
jgi:predicted pyridoxine 5'-phosphate oxidase superfamily flavin-nucleotide-binding protein